MLGFRISFNTKMSLKTAQRFMNHTSFRVADPQCSIEFYEKHFGMKLLKTLEHKQSSEFILGLVGANSLYQDQPFFKRGGLLQLKHENGATAENFTANNGNKEPHRGFGHICFSVPDLENTCESLEKAGVKFQKRLADGRQKNIAFALDPDGYWIELISNETPGQSHAADSLRLNHSMIRVKDKDVSLDFYTKKLGMTLVDTKDFPGASFTLFFLSFDPEYVEKNGRAFTEGLIELTYNYGSEKDDKVIYHSGNTHPVGFSHFGICVDQPQQFVDVLESQGVSVASKYGEGDVKHAATVADPDGYLVQILPKSDYTSPGKI